MSLLVDAEGAVPADLWFMRMKVESLFCCPNKEKHNLEVNTMFNMISQLLLFASPAKGKV